MERGYCFCCGNSKKLLKHHLSYEPDITVPVCKKCHFILHFASSTCLRNILGLKSKWEETWQKQIAEGKGPKHFPKGEYHASGI
jgi:hypothetical protein